MFSAIADGFGYLFGLLNSLGLWILNGIGKLLQPILDFLGAIFYFFYILGLVLVKVIMLVVGVGRLLLGLIVGFFKTITGFGYTGQATILPPSYTDAFNNLKPVFAMLQLDKLAYIFIFAIWIYTAWAAMQKIGKMR
ncbi:hypothetical protein P9314_05115 [Paenibacillus validus]|uniref:hypothetical protein n=1 Tax=Paenibacillus validus TaxID=44253 RepID=UPI000FD8ED19|nr:hypothetical protein [Paenibacillus validus]MED4600089.1 hypothetical protein [Paenibacillus validus]MED4605537.1 hypothetical protein [Paenibacillus validus]